MWLKTAISSNACGTSTLKSPLLRAFSVPDVHPRPRKRPPRCTLDCGFQTSESPALRGFVAGLRALATAALYLVLKSNGFRHSKNPPVKFGFSSKTVPANIAKKLPPQRCSKLLFIAVFQLLPQTAHVRFHERKRVHTRLCSKDRTQRLTRRKRGRFGWGAIITLDTSYTFTNIPGPGIRTAYFAAFGSWPGVRSQRTQRAFGTATRSCASLSRRRRGPAGLRDLFAIW